MTPTIMENSLTDTLTHYLKTYFGYNSFRPHQHEIITAIIQDKDVLTILPTGSGKSLCYQLPALLKNGTCIVISPLIALMIDQVRHLTQHTIPSAYLNSTLSAFEKNNVLAHLDRYKLIYVSPEKFLDPVFLAQLKTITVSAIIIDEAHCISQWGHSFRPEYRKLAMIKDIFPTTPVAAFTATATNQVAADISSQLCLKQPVLITGGFDRKNLMIRFHERINIKEQLESFLKNHKNQSGIIYAPTRKKVDDSHAWLTKQGYPSVKYHAGLSEQDRTTAQLAFINDKVPLIVATIAFGMGINKPDVRFVFHSGMPQSLEQYYQEIGRAGRDGEPADCLCLYSTQDKIIQKQFAYNEPDPIVQQTVLRKINQLDAFCHSTQCRRVELLRYFGESYTKSNCKTCDNCTDTIEWMEGTIIAQKILSCVYRLHQTFGVQHTIHVLRGSKNKAIIDRRHETLSTHGLLSMYTATDIQYFIYALINQGALTISDGKYPVLKLTHQSNAILFNSQTVQFKKRYKIQKTKETMAYHHTLLDQLKAKRTQIANQTNVAPFIVFSNRVLMDLARYLPNSTETLLKINGIGPDKAKKHGPWIIEHVMAFCKEHQMSPNQMGMA